jgi:putative redox protein
MFRRQTIYRCLTKLKGCDLRSLHQAYHSWKRISSTCERWNSSFLEPQGNKSLEMTKSVRDFSGGAIPSEFLKSYHLTGDSHRLSVSLKTNTGHTISTDVPKAMGGQDTSPQPVEMLLASWIGCTHVTALYVGRQMEPRISIARMEFDVSAFRDERGALELPIYVRPAMPAMLTSIQGSIRVHIKKGSVSQVQLQNLAEITEYRCPIANMIIQSGCAIDVEWKIGNQEAETE